MASVSTVIIIPGTHSHIGSTANPSRAPERVPPGTPGDVAKPGLKGDE